MQAVRDAQHHHREHGRRTTHYCVRMLSCGRRGQHAATSDLTAVVIDWSSFVYYSIDLSPAARSIQGGDQIDKRGAVRGHPCLRTVYISAGSMIVSAGCIIYPSCCFCIGVGASIATSRSRYQDYSYYLYPKGT